MVSDELITRADKVLMHTYNRFQIVLDSGEGVYLKDVNGKEYLDLAAGIAVFALGYGVKEYNDALKAQVDKLLHTSNLFYNEPAIKACEHITKMTGLDRVFMTNSGTEAIEGAIKLARKYYYVKNGKADSEIIAMNHSFHGRSMGALAVTGNESYRTPFGQLIGGVKFADYNNLDSVKALVNEKTCAIIMETVQGEGGLYPGNKEFIQGVRKLCDEKGIIMILDEIQCGMGRTGTMMAYEQYGVKPDIVTLAKALGCGVPVGAFVAKEEVANAMVPGDHGSTYGGNPFVAAAVNAVFDIFEKKKVLDNVNEVAPYLKERLNEVKAKHSDIVDVRGLGLMCGIEFNHPVGDIVKKAMEKGVIMISAGKNIVRLVPPLVITKSDVDKFISVLEEVI
ncbi:MAG TPA: aspartate aminotransferase family protein [Lachnospiraceae bacterium]|jgi:acetylornithine/N-succinyldiaminopimelate aminotransferase|nr:aspartate aminotransferase family protein [Lachnospiraceae bacterium]